MHWKIHPPRPSRLPSGFALGQSLGPRGAKSPPLGNLLGLGGCIFQYIPPLGSVRIQYLSSILEYMSSFELLLSTLPCTMYTQQISWYGVGSMRKWCNKSENESWQREDFEIVKIARQQILGRHSHTNASLTVLHLYHNVQCQMCTILTVYFSFGRNDDGWTYTTQPPLCDKIRGYVCIKCAI